MTILGLVAAAGSLYLGAQLMDISIWAMNFALMFALALGIDYALFIVYRFRGAFFGSRLSAEEATAVTMDTAGKAVLFSGLTVLISLSAVMLAQGGGRARDLPLPGSGSAGRPNGRPPWARGSSRLRRSCACSIRSSRCREPRLEAGATGKSKRQA